MNHRIGRLVFAAGVGLLVALLSYRWVIDPTPRAERQLQESVVLESRSVLLETLAIGQIDIVDPLAVDRKVGKCYVYRADSGWQVSGYYRREPNDLWHPYLISLDDSLSLKHLKVSDATLLSRESNSPMLEVLP